MSVRRFILWFVILVLTAIGIGPILVGVWRHIRRPSEPDYVEIALDKRKLHVTVDSLRAAEDYVFVMGVLGEGSGWPHYGVVRSNQAGRCEYNFQRDGRGWQASFSVDQQTVNDLQRLLVGSRFFDLHKSYVHKLKVDGAHWIVRVQAGDVKKSVTCGNYFPEPIEEVCAFVNERILKRHKKEIVEAVPVKWSVTEVFEIDNE